MSELAALRGRIPEVARDIKLNLQSVMAETSLTSEQKWGVAIASSVASRNLQLRRAVLSDARAEVSAAVIDDAMAAAALMAMNNVYYRFRHLIAKSVYDEKPARLRMNRLVRPAASKADFELFALAVSAIHGCGSCLQAHEKVVLDAGITEEQVHDAARLAATVHAAAVALEMSEESGGDRDASAVRAA